MGISEVIYKVLKTVFNVLSNTKANASIEDEVINVMNSSAVINLEFDDGHEVTLVSDDILGEYIKLRIMWHSSNDMFELIPYVDEGFSYRIKFD